jgi:hypothetical protein
VIADQLICLLSPYTVHWPIRSPAGGTSEPPRQRELTAFDKKMQRGQSARHRKAGSCAGVAGASTKFAVRASQRHRRRRAAFSAADHGTARGPVVGIVTGACHQLRRAMNRIVQPGSCVAATSPGIARAAGMSVVGVLAAYLHRKHADRDCPLWSRPACQGRGGC